MERLFWLLLVLSVTGGANWYYPQKYEPQIEAAQKTAQHAEQRKEELSSQAAEKDRTIADLQSQAADLGNKADEALKNLVEMGKKSAAMQADYEARLAAANARPGDALPPVKLPSPAVPVSPTPSSAAPPATAPGENRNAKRIAELTGDIEDAKVKLKEAENDLMKWDAGAYVSQDGTFHAPARKHSTTTNAPAEINAQRKRLRDAQAELALLSGT